MDKQTMTFLISFYGQDRSGNPRQLLTWGQYTPWYFGEITEAYAKKAANRDKGEQAQWIGTSY